ncbi:hypothetical protein V494_02017 [Pseudogymnoascus sp. VKM F-4513 (FW-928)]|nr:hypothetical protein V494_02017 [Pseudogymnoascus sp. VKM F-4513 (FW-928)]
MAKHVAIGTSLPPFGRDLQLYDKLNIDLTSQKLTRASSKNTAGLTKPVRPATLPGQPQLPLDSPLIAHHLIQEFNTEYLDNFAPNLWLVATQSHSHISSLTHQIVRGRNIVVTEDPKLHLLWYYDRVFIKPIPPYILSHAFWSFYFFSSYSPIPQPERDQILLAVRGYLRTWCYLIQHKSDFILATAAGGSNQMPLIPKNISYGAFMRFVSECRDSISDKDVSPRYHFGELRASRINFWGQMLLTGFSYYKPSGQYNDYFSRYFGVILFFFAFLSTALSAMQVALAAMAPMDVSANKFDKTWNSILLVSGWFAVLVLEVAACDQALVSSQRAIIWDMGVLDLCVKASLLRAEPAQYRRSSQDPWALELERGHNQARAQLATGRKAWTMVRNPR